MESSHSNAAGKQRFSRSLWKFLHHCLIQNHELLRNEFYAMKRSHRGLVETTQVIDSPNPEGPLLGENFSDHRAKCCCNATTFPATSAAFLVPPTLNSDWHQVSRCCRTVQINPPV